jgi:hypothetical protein
MAPAEEAYAPDLTKVEAALEICVERQKDTGICLGQQIKKDVMEKKL